MYHLRSDNYVGNVKYGVLLSDVIRGAREFFSRNMSHVDIFLLKNYLLFI